MFFHYFLLAYMMHKLFKNDIQKLFCGKKFDKQFFSLFSETPLSVPKRLKRPLSCARPIIVYYVPRRIMRVVMRRATMLAGDRSRGVISPASILSECRNYPNCVHWHIFYFMCHRRAKPFFATFNSRAM